jgi:hypothetical protein
MTEYELRVVDRAELTRLENYKFDTFDGLHLFKDYLDSMEEFLDTRAKKLLATGVADFTYQSFVNLQRRTFFLGLFAFFESRLTQLCRDQKEEKGIRLSLNDLAGTGFTRSERYLSIVLEIPVNSIKQWGMVTNYNLLRNCIAHNEGKLKRFSNKKLRSYVSNTKTLISVPPEDEIFFNTGFCEEAIDTIQEILKSLLSQVSA